jgi:hypothetical protein
VFAMVDAVVMRRLRSRGRSLLSPRFLSGSVESRINLRGSRAGEHDVEGRAAQQWRVERVSLKENGSRYGESSVNGIG